MRRVGVGAAILLLLPRALLPSVGSPSAYTGSAPRKGPLAASGLVGRGSRSTRRLPTRLFMHFCVYARIVRQAVFRQDLPGRRGTNNKICSSSCFSTQLLALPAPAVSSSALKSVSGTRVPRQEGWGNDGAELSDATSPARAGGGDADEEFPVTPSALEGMSGRALLAASCGGGSLPTAGRA